MSSPWFQKGFGKESGTFNEKVIKRLTKSLRVTKNTVDRVRKMLSGNDKKLPAFEFTVGS